MDKPTMSPTMECRSIMAKHIDNHKFFPDHMKTEAKEYVNDILSLIPKYLGNVELTYRRTILIENEKKTK